MMFGRQQRKRGPEQQESEQQERPQPATGAGAMGQLKNLAQVLLESDNIPAEVEKRFWPFYGKDAALTFLSKQEKNKLLRSYDDAAIAGLMSTFDYRFSAEDELAMTQGRTMASLRLSRSVGSGDMNERKALISQIQEMTYEENPEPSGGIISNAASNLKSAINQQR